MMKEAYVSYKIAKLLKEKGFNEETTHWYNVKESLINDYPVTYRNFSNPEKVWLAPTHQMACAWLREEHLIHVYAEYKAFFQEKPKKLYYHWIPFVKTLPHCPINKSGYPKETISLDVYCNTYEEAVEEALKYSLENLI